MNDADPAKSKKAVTLAKKPISDFTGTGFKARTPRQEQLYNLITATITPVDSVWDNIQGQPEVIFVNGAAGTGKTFAAVAASVDMLARGEAKGVLMLRPAVRVGHVEHGFLPGNLDSKMAPYMQPLYDSLLDLVPGEKLDEYFTPGKDIGPIPGKAPIDIQDLGFLRGTTFKNLIVILDEAQNATYHEIKTFMTRLGAGSRLVIMGDPDQEDLSTKGQDSGLWEVSRMFENEPGFAHVKFEPEDIVRHPRVTDIVNKFSHFEQNKRDMTTELPSVHRNGTALNYANGNGNGHKPH